MIDPKQFVVHVIRPTLAWIELGGVNAEVLLLGTALAESRLSYLKQKGAGPALGVYQMEPATHDDIWANYLVGRADLSGRIRELVGHVPSRLDHHLIGNLNYATAMARVFYLRFRKGLPAAANAAEMSHYHKRYYNTVLGKADPVKNEKHFVEAYNIVRSL